MASASTYVPIASVTLTSNGTVSFSSIPQTYTDLVVVGSLRTAYAATSDSIALDFTYGATEYSYTMLRGDGASATSTRATNQYAIYSSLVPAANQGAAFGTYIAHIFNYANTTTYKTALVRTNDANGQTSAVVGLRRNTAAINYVEIAGGNGAIVAGSTVTLYGILAA
jgi:hypothetical protein